MRHIRRTIYKLRHGRFWQVADRIALAVLLIFVMAFIVDYLVQLASTNRQNVVVTTPTIIKTTDKKVVYVPLIYGDESANDLREMRYSGRCSSIPKRLHQIWKDDNIPVAFKPQISSWMRYNNEWEYWFWTEASATELMQKHFPKYYALYESYSQDSERMDVIRYFILYAFGGVFADMDVAALASWNDLFSGHALVISAEHPAHVNVLWGLTAQKPPSTSVIMSIAEHQFLKRVIEKLHANWKDTEETDRMEKTGAFMLERHLKDYSVNGENGKQHFGSVCEAIYMASYEKLSPHFDESNSDILRQLCKTPGAATSEKGKQCAQLKLSKFKNPKYLPQGALAVRHFHKVVLEKSDEYSKVGIKELILDDDFVDVLTEIADLKTFDEIK